MTSQASRHMSKINTFPKVKLKDFSYESFCHDKEFSHSGEVPVINSPTPTSVHAAKDPSSTNTVVFYFITYPLIYHIQIFSTEI